MLSVRAQLLRLCIATGLLTGALAVVRGLPQIGDAEAGSAGSNGAVGTCSAPHDSATLGFDLQFVSPEAAHALLGQPAVTFVDCRSRGEFEAGHVAGSMHVEPEAVTLQPRALDVAQTSRTVVAYCDAQSECERSLRIANLFAQAGAHDVRVLEGGMPAWLAQGYPAESGECRDCEASP